MAHDSRILQRWMDRAVRLTACLAVCLAGPGCLGPAAVSQTRTRYNEVYRDTNDEQLLLNIVRLRYADSPVFLDLPNITSQFEVSGGMTYSNGLDGAGPGRSNLWTGQVGARDTPTLSYHPRGGKEIASALLTPLTAELLSVVNAGANIEQFLLLAVNDINDVPNATRATLMVPLVPDDNSDFRHGIAQLAALVHRRGIELVVMKSETSDETSDAIPLNLLEGRDLVNAAKEGYVFRSSGEDQVALRKREKEMVLRIRPEEMDSTEVREFARVFHLKPGLSGYKLKSELTDAPENRRSGAERNDTIYLNMRSVLQILTYLSKGVCIPEEHVLCGIAPMTPGPDGQLFDWGTVTEGLFRVCVQKRRPRNAEAAVFYRGYWYYIASNDIDSRAALAVLELLFSVQESEGKPLGPLLTIPVGGG